MIMSQKFPCPAGMNSPMSSSHPGNSGAGGGGTTFSSSSLNALQAISEGVGNPMPSPLTSPPPHKPDSSPSINSTNQVAGVPCKLPPYTDSKSPASSLGPAGEQQSQQHLHTPTGEVPPDKPDSQTSREPGPPVGETQRRVAANKSHKKLLQLLTTPTDELVPPNHTPSSGPGSTPEAKDGTPGVTSPSSSTGVSSSTGGNHGPVSSSASTGHFSSQSVQEKHKILHKLLQNGNTPDDVARITAEATGKSSLESGTPESGPVAAGGTRGSESKQEQHSPKKEKQNAILHYLLNKDDSKEGSDSKPKQEESEGRGVQGAGVTSSDPHCVDGKVKLEPSDEVRLWPGFVICCSKCTQFWSVILLMSWCFRRRHERHFWLSQGATLGSTPNLTPEQGRKLVTNQETCLTVYMVSHSVYLA